VGSGAAAGNVGGTGDTAIGFNALQNDNGVGSNTAVGVSALGANTIGFNNAAFGIRALESNIDGLNNTAIGNLALDLNADGSDNVALGRHAGDGITTANNNIVIGHGSGVHSRFGQEDNVCYIGNIYGANVNNMGGIARAVIVDPDGRLGTVAVADGPTPRSPKGVQPQAIPDAQAMLNRKVEALEATVAQLTAQLKEQASQIQKVSAQLEVSKPAPQVVANKP
jgi:hypothetical protein